MQIELKIEGGIASFPGLAKPRTFDSKQLSKEEAAELERLVNAVHFFDLPTKVGKAQKGAADYRQYTITIVEGKQRHTIRLTEPVEDANLQALLNLIAAKAKG